MKQRDPKHATRQPTRTELENQVHWLHDTLENRDKQIASLVARLRDAQGRLDEIVKLARKP